MATEDGDSSKTAEPQIADQAGDDTSTMPAEKLTTTQEFAPIMNIDTDGAPPPSTVASAAEADELLEKYVTPPQNTLHVQHCKEISESLINML